MRNPMMRNLRRISIFVDCRVRMIKWWERREMMMRSSPLSVLMEMRIWFLWRELSKLRLREGLRLWIQLKNWRESTRNSKMKLNDVLLGNWERRRSSLRKGGFQTEKNFRIIQSRGLGLFADSPSLIRELVELSVQWSSILNVERHLLRSRSSTRRWRYIILFICVTTLRGT